MRTYLLLLLMLVSSLHAQSNAWWIRVLYLNSEFLDVQAVAKNGKRYTVVAFPSEKNEGFDLVAVIDNIYVPIYVLERTGRYAPVKAINSDGSYLELQAETVDGKQLAIVGTGKSGEITHIKAVGPDDKIYDVKAIQIYDVKGIEVGSRKNKVSIHGTSVEAQVRALP